MSLLSFGTIGHCLVTHFDSGHHKSCLLHHFDNDTIQWIPSIIQLPMTRSVSKIVDVD